MKFAKVLHENGETTGNTTQQAEKLGKDFGLTAKVVPGWSDIQLQTSEDDVRLLTIGVASPTGVDMDRVSSVEQTIDKALAEHLALPSLNEAIDKISRAPPAPTWLFTLAAAGGAVALSLIFGVEHLTSVVIIALSAGAGAWIRRLLAKYSSNPFVQPFVAALLAGLVGAVTVDYDLSSSLRLIAVCPCMVLVPGPHILNGMIDLLRARLSLAVARLVYAGFIIIAISTGLLLTLTLLNVSLPVDESGRAVAIWVDVPAAGVAAAAYSVFYSTPLRMIGWPVAIGMVAHALRYETLAVGGNAVAAAFVASLFVGLVMTPIARRRHMPFAAIGFACVVSMMPGVYLFRMASGLLQIVSTSNPTLQLIGATAYDGATAIGIILALAFGLVVPMLTIDHYMKP